MNLINFDFKNNYNVFLTYLYSLEDIKYKNFHSKLILDNNLIGIRMPILKKIAKEISKGDYDSFIKSNTLSIYEEKMLYGLVLGCLKIDFNDVLRYLDVYIPYIDNWAICDCVCANLKVFKTNLEKGYNYILKCINSDQDFIVRFGIVLLLDFYINDNYIDDIFDMITKIKNKSYYVQMAEAWLISKCYIKYPIKTYNFLLKYKLDDFIINKSISKICDSYQVSIEDKNKIKKIKSRG